MFNKAIFEKHIDVNPEIQHGKPCVKGTRIPIHVILEMLAVGMTFDEIKKEYSPITQEDIQACISYAALLADERELLSQPAI